MIVRIGLKKNSKGMSLIELMISMAIGLIMLAGVITIFVNSRSSYSASQTQNILLADARFATHMLRQDIQMAGSFGSLASSNLITTTLGNLATDCEPGWYINTRFHIVGADNTNPYLATCIGATQSYMLGSDVLVLRYADSTSIVSGSLATNTVYLRSTPSEGQLFTGAAPALVSETLEFPGINRQLQSVVFYVSDFTDTPGDGYPSLHRIRLSQGPTLVDDLIVPGVQDMQLQYGVDSDDDGSVDYYVNADNAVIDWTDLDSIKRIKSVSVNLLMVSEFEDVYLDTAATFTYADKVNIVAEDHKIREAISTVIPLVNILN